MRTNFLVALQQAESVIERDEQGTLSDQARLDAVVALAEWGVFSARNVSTLTGMPYTAVLDVVRNPARKGGRITRAAVPHIIALIQSDEIGKMGTAELVAAVGAGASLTMIARLSGLPHSTLHRWWQKSGAKS